MRKNSWYEGENAVQVGLVITIVKYINIFGYVVRAGIHVSKPKGKRNKAWTYARSRRSPFQHANA